MNCQMEIFMKNKKKHPLFIFGFLCWVYIFLSGCGGPAGKLAVGPGPGSLAADDSGRYLYAACAGKGEVQTWDLKRRRLAASAEAGAGLIRLQFFGEEDNLAVLAAGGKLVRFLQTPGLQPLGELSLEDRAAAWTEDPRAQLVIACCPDSNLLRMFRDGQPLEPVETGRQPRDLFLQPDSDKLWVANSKSYDLAVVSVDQGRVVKRIPVRPNPVKFLTAQGRAKLFVFCTGQDALPPRAVLQAIDTVYQTAALTYTLGEDIRDCALDATGRHCFSLAPGRVLVKDLDAGGEQEIQTVVDAAALAVSPDGKQVYVSTPQNQSVYIYQVRLK